MRHYFENIFFTLEKIQKVCAHRGGFLPRAPSMQSGRFSSSERPNVSHLLVSYHFGSLLMTQSWYPRKNRVNRCRNIRERACLSATYRWRMRAFSGILLLLHLTIFIKSIFFPCTNALGVFVKEYTHKKLSNCNLKYVR